MRISVWKGAAAAYVATVAAAAAAVMIWRITRVALTMKNPFFFCRTLSNSSLNWKSFSTLLKCVYRFLLFFRSLHRFNTNKNFNLVLCNCSTDPFPIFNSFHLVRKTNEWARMVAALKRPFFPKMKLIPKAHIDRINKSTTVGFLFNLSIDNEQFPWAWNGVHIWLNPVQSQLCILCACVEMLCMVWTMAWIFVLGIL